MSRDLLLFRVASAALRGAPIGPTSRAAYGVGRWFAPRVPGTSALIENLRIAGAEDPHEQARKGIGYYAKYWVDTFKLPTLHPRIIDRRFSFVGYHHILDVQQAGATPVMVLPHLGSWEWAAAWLGMVDGNPVTAVVEKLEPADVFEWFRSTREAYGVDVVPLGSDALRVLMATAAQSNSIICLVADRDIAGTGVEVEFFERRTTIPGGPALLSLRSGCPLLPVVIYDRGSTRECRVHPPIWPRRTGRLRDDVALTTQRIAGELEQLISAEPTQWHVLEPLWPETRPGDGS